MSNIKVLPYTNNIYGDEVKKRFFSKIDKMQGGECWNWTGASAKDGYGSFWIGPSMIGAHKFSWIIYYGAISDNLLVCHKCDNKKCVNPTHLYLGTSSDNTKDRYNRFPLSGRGRNYSKLSKEEADLIKFLHDSGKSYIQISKLFDVTDKTISNICRGKTTSFKGDK